MCSVTHFWVYFDAIMAHYTISNRGSQVFIFYLLVFDRIHDAMHLNKMSRTSGRKTGHNIKNTAVYLNVDRVLFNPCLY